MPTSFQIWKEAQQADLQSFCCTSEFSSSVLSVCVQGQASKGQPYLRNIPLPSSIYKSRCCGPWITDSRYWSHIIYWLLSIALFTSDPCPKSLPYGAQVSFSDVFQRSSIRSSMSSTKNRPQGQWHSTITARNLHWTKLSAAIPLVVMQSLSQSDAQNKGIPPFPKWLRTSLEKYSASVLCR